MGDKESKSDTEIGNSIPTTDPQRPKEASTESRPPEDRPEPSSSESPDSSGTLTPPPRRTRSRKRQASRSEDRETDRENKKKRAASKETKGKPSGKRRAKGKTNMSGPTVETLAAAEELREEDVKHLSTPAFFCLMHRTTKASFKIGFNQMEQQFTQMENQWRASEKRIEKTEAKVSELDERLTAMERRNGEGAQASRPMGGQLPRLNKFTPRPAPAEELCFRQLIMGPADVKEDGTAAVEELAHEVLYNIMGFPNKDPFRVGVESVSMTRKINNQMATAVYAKVTFADTNARKQVLLTQGKLAQAERDVDVRIVVPHYLKRMEREIERTLYYLRTITRGSAGRRCQTTTEIDQTEGVLGMYRWKVEGQPPGKWAYIEHFEDMTKPELKQFEQFTGKTEDHLREEWKRLIEPGHDPNSGKIQ